MGKTGHLSDCQPLQVDDCREHVLGMMKGQTLSALLFNTTASGQPQTSCSQRLSLQAAHAQRSSMLL